MSLRNVALRRIAWGAVGPMVLAGLLVAVPMGCSSTYVLHVLILLFLSILMGQAWNLLGGLAGQLSLGHAAFFGIGAYSAALLHQRAELAWLGILCGLSLSSLTALAVGRLCFRLRGPYFALGTLALAEILRLVAVNWTQVTHGGEGIVLAANARLAILPGLAIRVEGKAFYYYTALALSSLATLTTYVVARSRLGYYLAALRDDEQAASSLGVNVRGCKLVSLVLSAAVAAIAGSVYGLYTGYVDPNTVLHADISIQMVLICIIGGAGRVHGPVLGAVVVCAVAEMLRPVWGAGHLLIYGGFVIGVILFMPYGIAGAIDLLPCVRRCRRLPNNGDTASG